MPPVGVSPKLFRHWTGSWRIQDILGSVTYRVVLGPRTKIVHRSRSKLAINRSPVRMVEDEGVGEEQNVLLFTTFETNPMMFGDAPTNPVLSPTAAQRNSPRVHLPPARFRTLIVCLL